jgi:hypothetical protein
MKNTMLNKHVIVRADKAGVFFGTLTNKEGDEVILKDARKLYYWSGAKTIEDIADKGVTNPYNCKFTVVVNEITIIGACQIIPCTKDSIICINSVPVWKA